MRIKKLNQKGSILLFVSMMVAFLMVMALSVAQVLVFEVKMGSDFASSSKALYGRQSAFELSLLNKNNTSGVTLNNSTQILGTLTSPFVGTYLFNSRGLLGGVRRENDYFFTKPDIASGSAVVLALKSDGTVWNWGSNSGGQLGDGTTNSYQYYPVRVKGPGGSGYLDNIVAIDRGYNAIALKSDGTVWTWGYWISAISGPSAYPIQIPGPGGAGYLQNIIDVDEGTSSLALKSDEFDGTVWTWGGNGYGELGDNTNVNRQTPVQVKGPGGVGYLQNVVDISGGFQASFAVKFDGTVWAWGRNYGGELGDNTTTDRWTPVQVKGPGGVGYLQNVVSISCHSLSQTSSCSGLKSDGTVWAWGDNAYGELGDGTTIFRRTPVQVKGPGGVGYLSNIIESKTNFYSHIAVKSDGTVWTWGRNAEGQLGINTLDTSAHTTPIQVKGPGGVGYLSNIFDVAAQGNWSLAIGLDGSLWAWGNNYNGTLGDGTTTNRLTPVRVKGRAGNGYFKL